jgi:hypothetical protein
VAFYLGEERPRCLRRWRGVLSEDWLGRAVSSHGGVLACAASEFWRDVGVQGCRDGRADRSVTSTCVGVRWWPRWSNGQGSKGGYASGVLEFCGARVREGKGPGVSVG